MSYKVKINEKLSTEIPIIFGCELEFNLKQGTFFELGKLRKYLLTNNYYNHIVEFDNNIESTLELSTAKLKNSKEDLLEFKNICNRIKSLNPIYNMTEGTHFHFDSSIIHIMNYDIEHKKFIEYYYNNLSKIKYEDHESFLYFMKFRVSIEKIINKLSLLRQDKLKSYSYKLSADINEVANELIKQNAGPEEFELLDKFYALNIKNYTRQLIYHLITIDTFEERRANPTCNYEQLYILLNFLINVYIYGGNKDNRKTIDAIYENGLLDPTLENLNGILDLIFENEDDKENTIWLFNEEIDYGKVLRFR